MSKDDGEYVAPALGKVTIGEPGPAWLERQRGHLKASTMRSYELSWATHVVDRWGDVPISRVHHSDVQAWIADLSSQRGPEVVRIAYSVLARILDDAARDRRIAVNQARGVKLPKVPPARHTYLTAAQLQQLADESGAYKSLVLALGIGGLRLGEAAATVVSDIDFLRRRIHLHRNAVKVGGTFVVGPLKNHKNRTVALPAFVVDEIARTCEGKGRDDLVWPSPRGG